MCEEHLWKVSVFQRVHLSNLVYCGELLAPPHQTPKLEDHPLLLHPKTEDVPFHSEKGSDYYLL
jgi:hypothetical protein